MSDSGRGGAPVDFGLICRGHGGDGGGELRPIAGSRASHLSV